MAIDENIGELSNEEILETLTEDQAKFILHASIIAGHLSRHSFEQGVKLSRSVRHG